MSMDHMSTLDNYFLSGGDGMLSPLYFKRLTTLMMDIDCGLGFEAIAVDLHRWGLHASNTIYQPL